MSIFAPRGCAPGFDPNHVAARGGWKSLVSAVAIGGSFINLLNGVVGTASGAPTSSMTGIVGLGTKFAASTDKVSFAAPTTAFTSIIMAALVIPTAVSGGSYRTYISTSSSNSAWRLGVNGGNVELVAGGVAEVVSGITLLANVPYFLAASANTATANFAVTNLASGQIKTASASSVTASAGNGTLLVGNDYISNVGAIIACGMVAGNTAGLLSVANLNLWASRPWDYWYPSSLDEVLGVTFPWWAVRNNSAVIGAGAH